METIKFRIYNQEEKKMIISGATPTMLSSFFDNTSVLHTRDKMPYQQFTGLLDKQGKEIYEGDIVKFDFGLSCGLDEIIFNNGRFELKNTSIDNSKRDVWNVHNYCEIIGNIYENKNLLN